jgi:transcriptional regulator with GAF, ATPase, and Fis domain/CHASE2 domain-containing sensor protein
MKPRPSWLPSKPLYAVAALAIAAMAALLQTNLEFLRNADEDVLLRLRGKRALPSQFLLVAVDENDLRALGGWPITRDYYGYLIHILTEKNAKAIGLDVMLDAPNRQYPEYDRMLAEFIRTSARVVLPSVMDEARPFDPVVQIGPLPAFAQGAAGIGFSNLGDGPVVRRIPVAAGRRDTLVPSFALAMAKTMLGAEIHWQGRHVLLSIKGKPKVRIPLDGKGRMMLNPAGDFSSIRSIRLAALLRKYETAPDSLDLRGMLVLVAATAPSLPVLKSMPPGFQVPASLIQATAAENILNESWLRFPAFPLCLAWILLWMGLAYLPAQLRRAGLWIAGTAAGAAVIIGFSAGLFIVFRLVMPLFTSFLLFLGTAVFLRRLKNSRERRKNARLSEAIESQIAAKEKALADAEQRLSEAEIQLAKEISENERLSETGRRLAEEKEASVLELEKQVRDLKASFDPERKPGEIRFPEIICEPKSPMAQVLRMVEKAAPDDIPVLIQGETGTGKELVARAIHDAGPRRKKPFIALNCGALSESLLESELFGHEKGAFTGAVAMRRGRFEMAQGGTLFLDEITETTSAFQAKLLRVLQEGAFERVGGERTQNADVRIIAAHNSDLNLAVREKRFREDLYFRLKGFPIELPPLRNRPDDISVLALFFCRKYGQGSKIRVSDAVMEKLNSYRWPGNVRELENTMRRAALLARSDGRDMVQNGDLPEEIRKESADAEPVLYHPMETQILETLRAFRFTHSAIGQTARALGNRDRGTVTEYFRGLCFQYLAEHRGDVRSAAAALAGSKDPGITGRVEAKMRDYVGNARASLAEKPILDYTKPSCFKGLPQKFHPYLQRLIDTVI